MASTQNMDYHIDGFELIKAARKKGRNKATYKCGSVEMTIGQFLNYSAYNIEWKGKSLFQLIPCYDFELGTFDVLFSSFNFLEELIDDLQELAYFKTVYYKNLDRIKELHYRLLEEKEYLLEE